MIEDGLERKINDKQNQVLIDQEQKEEVRWREIQRKFNIGKSEIKNQKDKLIRYIEESEDKKKLNEIINYEDKTFKKAIYDKERTLNLFQREDAKERNKFSDKLQSASLKKKKIQPLRIKKSQSKTSIYSTDKKIGNSISQNKIITINENHDNENEDENDNPILNKLNNEKKQEEEKKQELLV